MRVLLLCMLAAVLIPFQLQAQSKKEKDIAAIKDMCGCHQVQFNFVETFNYAEDSTYTPSKEKHDRALEYVQLVEESDDKIVLQHLLIVGTATNPRIIKHWRQDWIYENQDFYIFDKNNNWTYERKSKDEVEGQWTQKVYQVDDSPRYEGSATWVHVDGKSYWENTTPAPLPRREYTTRNDYNVMIRQNRQEITSFGWIHEQDNKKVVRGEESDFILAEEKGLNTYTSVAPSKCAAAAEWWQENKEMWSVVRGKWDKIFARDQDLALKPAVDDKPLFMHLFSMDETAKPKEIKKIISAFVIEE